MPGCERSKRLDLVLLVETDHRGVVWRDHVQRDHIAQFVVEALVVAELEGADQVLFEPVSVPEPVD